MVEIGIKASCLNSPGQCAEKLNAGALTRMTAIDGFELEQMQVKTPTPMDSKVILEAVGVEKDRRKADIMRQHMRNDFNSFQKALGYSNNGDLDLTSMYDQVVQDWEYEQRVGPPSYSVSDDDPSYPMGGLAGKLPRFVIFDEYDGSSEAMNKAMTKMKQSFDAKITSDIMSAAGFPPPKPRVIPNNEPVNTCEELGAFS